MKGFLKFFIFLLLAILFFNCSTTNRLTIGVTEPSIVFIPSEKNSIGIINRSIPSESNKSIDEIDKILSLEGKQLDIEGSEASILGLRNELDRSNKFEIIKNIKADESIKKGLGVFPAPISWKIIDSISRVNEVDIIYSLEFYDTDSKLDYKIVMVPVINSLGIKVKVPHHNVTIRTLIKSGWRIYDSSSKLLLDEFISNNEVISTGQGINPLKALEAVIGRKEAVIDISTKSGGFYALRIKPSYKRVTREYYVKGTTNFEIAKRRAQTGDWQGAADLWEKELTNNKSKIAGRACYNMAIINEINGDLDTAIKWASKAYADYKDKNALRYLNILKFRIVEQTKLNTQLED